MGFFSRLFGEKGLGGTLDPLDIGFGKIFEKGDKTVTLEPMKEEFQMDLGKSLSEIFKKYLPSFEPGKEFGGLSELTTPSKYEQQGLDLLQQYIGGGIKPTGVLGKASDVLSKTLGGEYDPFTSEYYGSLRRNIEKERKQSMSDLNKYLGKYGLGGTSFRAGRVADIGQESFGKVSDVLSRLQEGERINQLNAIRTAMDFTTTTEGQIQNKLSTIMNIGALPRELQGVAYQDFLRQQGEFADVADRSQRLFEYNIPYGKKSLDYKTPSIFDEILGYGGDIASIVSQFIPGAPGGGNTQNLGTRRTSTQGQAVGQLNQFSLKNMSEPQFNEYWNLYS